MSFFFCKRRSRPTDPRAPTRAVGRRKGRRGARARKKVGLCGGCRRVPSEEAAVAEKLRALRELMPPSGWGSGGGEAGEGHGKTAAAEADRLFEEAASYIILLKTRVGVLQKLVELYVSQPLCHSPKVED